MLHLNEHTNSPLYILGYIACNFVQMFLVISKAFTALLRKGNVMTTSCLLKILWFIPWRNWVPNVLIQWSSLLSLSDLFLCALPWSRICSMEYKIMFSSMWLHMVSNLTSRGFKIPSNLRFGWKDYLCSNSCMFVSLKYALMSRILWLENPERWKIVTSKKSTDIWFILQSTLSDLSWLLNWLRKSDNSSFDLSGHALVLGDRLLLILGEGRCWLFGILKARESGLLHSCHYLSVKKTVWKIQWPGHLGLN